jgi:hypothetical protein
MGAEKDIFIISGQLYRKKRYFNFSVCFLLKAELETIISEQADLFRSRSKILGGRQEKEERKPISRCLIKVSMWGSRVWFYKEFLRIGHNDFQNFLCERQEARTLSLCLLSPLVEAFLQGLRVHIGAKIRVSWGILPGMLMLAEKKIIKC